MLNLWADDGFVFEFWPDEEQVVGTPAQSQCSALAVFALLRDASGNFQRCLLRLRVQGKLFRAQWHHLVNQADTWLDQSLVLLLVF